MSMHNERNILRRKVFIAIFTLLLVAVLFSTRFYYLAWYTISFFSLCVCLCGILAYLLDRRKNNQPELEPVARENHLPGSVLFFFCGSFFSLLGIGFKDFDYAKLGVVMYSLAGMLALAGIYNTLYALSNVLVYIAQRNQAHSQREKRAKQRKSKKRTGLSTPE